MGFSTSSSRQIIAFVAVMLTLQVGGFIILGQGPAGTLFTDCLSIAANILAITCSIAASRRGRGASRIFWLLFGSAFALLLLGNAGWAYCRYFNVTIAANAVFPSLSYRFYAVPMRSLCSCRTISAPPGWKRFSIVALLLGSLVWECIKFKWRSSMHSIRI
jgi:hypothetical protein